MQQEFTYSGTGALEVLKDAVNYNRFLEGELASFIAPENSALDFGAGGGEFAQRLRARGITVAAVEPDAALRNGLSGQGFSTHSTLEEAAISRRIYSLNVLEHIEDDVAALQNLHAKLEAGGKLFLYVPAFPCLYSSFDKHVGHFRRYRKKELVGKCARAGFSIARAEYVDSLGFFCWLVMAKCSRDAGAVNPLMVKNFDRALFPVSRMLDGATKFFFGKNLLVIAQKK